jgi:hypothetical protein
MGLGEGTQAAMTNAPQGRHAERRLVGVFGTQRQADAAVADLIRSGVDRHGIRRGDMADEVASLKAEMREELSHTTAAPGAIGTKEMTKGLGLLTVIGAVVGALVLLPLSAVGIGGLAWWARALIVAAIGAVAGGTIGFVIGGSLATKGPADPAAAARGVVVAVDEDSPRVVAALQAHDPVRVDRVDGAGAPVEVVDTEETRQPGGTPEDLARNLERDDHRRET